MNIFTTLPYNNFNERLSVVTEHYSDEKDSHKKAIIQNKNSRLLFPAPIIEDTWGLNKDLIKLEAYEIEKMKLSQDKLTIPSVTVKENKRNELYLLETKIESQRNKIYEVYLKKSEARNASCNSFSRESRQEHKRNYSTNHMIKNDEFKRNDLYCREDDRRLSLNNQSQNSENYEASPKKSTQTSTYIDNSLSLEIYREKSNHLDNGDNRSFSSYSKEEVSNNVIRRLSFSDNEIIELQPENNKHVSKLHKTDFFSFNPPTDVKSKKYPEIHHNSTIKKPSFSMDALTSPSFKFDNFKTKTMPNDTDSTNFKNVMKLKANGQPPKLEGNGHRDNLLRKYEVIDTYHQRNMKLPDKIKDDENKQIFELNEKLESTKKLLIISEQQKQNYEQKYIDLACSTKTMKENHEKSMEEIKEKCCYYMKYIDDMKIKHKNEINELSLKCDDFMLYLKKIKEDHDVNNYDEKTKIDMAAMSKLKNNDNYMIEYSKLHENKNKISNYDKEERKNLLLKYTYPRSNSTRHTSNLGN